MTIAFANVKTNAPSDPFKESVYSLIPEDYVAPQKQKQYKSKFAKQARDEYFSGMKKSASMGPAKVTASVEDGFLKKGDGLKGKAQVTPAKQSPDRTIRKAAVPKEPPVMPQESGKDFIKNNALENINSAAKKPKDNSPSYRFKVDYGKTPEYLKKRNQELLKSKEKVEDPESKLQQKLRGEGLVPLPEDERVKILEGLKANWDKLNNDYQKLSLTVDTVPKISRKVNMEQQLKQLEMNISKFSHSNILVNFGPAYKN